MHHTEAIGNSKTLQTRSATYLKDHADMSAVDAGDFEVVQEHDRPLPERIGFVAVSDLNNSQEKENPRAVKTFRF